MKFSIKSIVLWVLFTGFAFAGDVTVSVIGINPLSVNVKGTSSNQQAGGISVYLYYCDDGVTTLDLGNVNASQIETTWDWGTIVRTQSIQTGSWEKGGYTFTRRLYYDNADIGAQDDFWTTGGINALVCTFSAVGSGHAFIEVNGSDGLADWSGSAHTVTYGIQDKPLPVELAAFTARNEDQSVILEWQTACEISNLGFILERRDENSEWQQIASYKSCEALRGQGTRTSVTKYSYTDNMITGGHTYTYRLSDVNTNGEVQVLATVTADVIILPTSTQLYPAYPNPFNPSTTIQYDLVKDSHVVLEIYDVLGRLVRQLANQQQTAGVYTTTWDGTNDLGLTAPSGTYLVRMRAGGVQQTQKILFLK